MLSTYNGSAYLQQMLDSLDAQTHTHWRLLAMDDGSSDATMRILQSAAEADPRVEILGGRERAIGASRSFLALLSEVETQYFAFADQDDRWHPRRLEIGLREVERVEIGDRPALAISNGAICDADLQDTGDTVWDRFAFAGQAPPSVERLLLQNVASGNTFTGNRALLEQIVAHPPPETFHHDWWCLLVASAIGRVGLIPDRLVDARIHQNNTIGLPPVGARKVLRRALMGRRRVNELTGLPTGQAAALIESFGEQMAPDLKTTTESVASRAGERVRTIDLLRWWRLGVAIHPLHRQLALVLGSLA